MKLLRVAYRSDHALEIIFSFLRWFFLVWSVIVFSVQYLGKDSYHVSLNLFISLVVFGFIYMAITEYFLHKSPEGSNIYNFMTKFGPCFDFIAFCALVPLTGGIESPLFPLSYLIILHVAVYWRFAGGLIAAIIFSLMYSITFFIQDTASYSLITYLSQIFFLLLVGGLGGIIVSRERQHFSEKNLLVEVANRDYLTNLLNHRSFQECLRKALDDGLDFYLILADIDKFKSINDKYGHVTGDLVLREISSIVTSIIPVNQGKVFRYGGEEFAIILNRLHQDEVTKLLLEIKQAISYHIFHSNEANFSVTMSFGCCKQNGESPNQLVEKADKLLYEAKHKGRNQIVY